MVVAGFILPLRDVKLAAQDRGRESSRRGKAGLEPAAVAALQQQQYPRPMKMAMGPKGIISLLLLTLAAKLLASRGGHLLRHVTAPVGRLLGWPSPAEPNLRAEVEARFPEFLVPDKYVDFPRQQRFSLPKRETLSKGLETAATRLKRAAGRAAAVRRPTRARAAALLEWTSQRKFHLHRPHPRHRRIAVQRIKPLPPDARPLLAIVNSRSGGRQGKGLLKRLKAALCKGQVFDISKVSMVEALKLYSNVSRPLTILCCGGDGTVSRVLEAVAEMRWSTPEPPRVAVLPLGTGNDLAKSLDWGEHVRDWTGGWTLLGPVEAASDSAVLEVLEDVRRGLDRRMDRWQVDITPGTAVPSIGEGSSRPPLRSMVAYLGIGVDGKVALDFHHLREKCPWLFVSPTLNKALYGLMGLHDFFVRSCKNLPDKVELWCDGQLVPLPPLTESFIILNINSHAGGVQLWPEHDYGDPPPPSLASPRLLLDGGNSTMMPGSNVTGAGVVQRAAPFGPSRWNDGMLEVVAASGVLHLGKIRVGWAQPIRLAQAREIRIRTKSFLPGQIDGEPWKLPRCELTIRAAPQQARVVQYLSQELVQFTDWLVTQGQLASEQRQALLKAFKAREAPITVIPRK